MPYVQPTLKPNQFAIYAISRMKNTTFEPNIIIRDDGQESVSSKIVKKYINAYIPITFFDGEQSSYFSTYDENLQMQENAQFTFSFSVAKYLNGELNPIFYLLVENRRLRLQTFYQKIDFVITSITPQITNNNVVYQVSCQDVFSYDLSKQNVAITYEPEVPGNIRELSDAVIEIGKVGQRWSIDPKLETSYYADFPSLQQVRAGVTSSPSRMKATVSLSGTTIFNALVEIAKKFSANIEIDYSDDEEKPNIIRFKNKLFNTFQGYQLRPEVNLSSFSVSRTSDNFCSVMHVNGGEDADGNIISINPTIPMEVQKYFLMLYPRVAPSAAEVYRNTSYEFAVHEDLSGNCYLYKRQGGAFTKVRAYTPWTKKTANEIREDFNNFTFADGSHFSSANSNEVEEYFDFLAYRAKAGASLFYNFDYYHEAGLMDEDTYNEIENIFSKDLRNANIILACLTYQYYSLSNELQRFKDQEEELYAQLAALEEEWYNYTTGKLETPETVVEVLGATETDPGSLNSATIFNIIDNEKLSVLNKLKSEIWVDRYYNLLFTLEGTDFLKMLLKDLDNKITNQETIFYDNLDAANKLLDEYAQPGYITFESTSVPQTTDFSASQSIKIGKLNAAIDIVVDSTSRTTSSISASYFAILQDSIGPNYTLFFSESPIQAGSPNVYAAMFNQAVSNTGITESTTANWPTGDGWEDVQDVVVCGSIVTLTPTVMNKYGAFEFHVYTKDDDDVVVREIFKPLICTSRKEREDYLANNQTSIFSNYAVHQKKYNKALSYIKENPLMLDSLYAGEVVERRGIYQIQYDYWCNIRDNISGDPYGYYKAKNAYSTPFNLQQWLQEARDTQASIWLTIYNTYGDFIAETSFSDEDQLSSAGLYMSALQNFTTYNAPTVSYNTTTINSRVIDNLQDRVINIGEIVYVHNKDASSQYSGKLRVTIPRNKNGVFYREERDTSIVMHYTTQDAPDGYVSFAAPIDTLELINAKCRLFNDSIDSSGYFYPFYTKADGTVMGEYLSSATLDEASELTIDKIATYDKYVEIYLICPIEQATGIILNKANINAITILPLNNSEYITATILDVVMDEVVKPIELQVTAVSRKLREATSQITVSTDRTIDLIYQRLLKQARL